MSQEGKNVNSASLLSIEHTPITIWYCITCLSFVAASCCTAQCLHRGMGVSHVRQPADTAKFSLQLPVSMPSQRIGRFSGVACTRNCRVLPIRSSGYSRVAGFVNAFADDWEFCRSQTCRNLLLPTQSCGYPSVYSFFNAFGQARVT